MADILDLLFFLLFFFFLGFFAAGAAAHRTHLQPLVADDDVEADDERDAILEGLRTGGDCVWKVGNAPQLRRVTYEGSIRYIRHVVLLFLVPVHTTTLQYSSTILLFITLCTLSTKSNTNEMKITKLKT